MPRKNCTRKLTASSSGCCFFRTKNRKKNTEKIKIRYIGKRRGEVESEKKKEKRRRERKTTGRLMPELNMLAAGKRCAL